MSLKSFTGLTGFRFKTQDGEVVTVENIKNLQEISVSKEQSIEKAYGDNQVAEMAVSNGIVELSATFHKIPLEQRQLLFGLKKDTDGIVYVGSDSTPPLVNVLFEKTMEDGSRETVGLIGGRFLYPEEEGNTKGEDVEFSQTEASAEFMGGEVEGMEGTQTILLGHDEAGSTAKYDAIYTKVFGAAPPVEGGA